MTKMVVSVNSIRKGLFSKSSRQFSNAKFPVFQSMYQPFFKTNVAYVSYIVVGAIAFEAVYGKFTDFVWENNNRGVRVDSLHVYFYIYDWFCIAFVSSY